MATESELHQLTAATMDRLDRGAAAAALDKAIRQAVLDCLDRPSDDRARKITLQLDLVPVNEIHENTISCEGAKGVYRVRLKLPDWESGALDFGVRTNGMLVFNENSPGNHRQSTFMDEGDEEG